MPSDAAGSGLFTVSALSAPAASALSEAMYLSLIHILYAHPELIPIEGILGGTMRFSPDESAVRVLSTASYMRCV